MIFWERTSLVLLLGRVALSDLCESDIVVRPVFLEL